MKIRPPKFRELGRVVEMGLMMHDESPEDRDVPFDHDYAYAFAQTALQRYLDGDGGFIHVAESESGSIVGFVIGSANPRIYSAVPYAADCAIYVIPEKRGSSAGYKMICAFEEWAKIKGIGQVKNGASTRIDPEKTHAFYERLGYTYVGGIYSKKLTGEGT